MTEADSPIVESALPSVRSRVIAFVGVLAGGALGSLIGYAFIQLQCDGSCAVPSGLAMWVGAFVGSLGAAVVAVLTLRTVREWTTRTPRG